MCRQALCRHPCVKTTCLAQHKDVKTNLTFNARMKSAAPVLRAHTYTSTNICLTSPHFGSEESVCSVHKRPKWETHSALLSVLEPRGISTSLLHTYMWRAAWRCTKLAQNAATRQQICAKTFLQRKGQTY
eukprot:5185086-Amphidinium_carterae.1